MSDLRIDVDGRDLYAEWTGDNPETRTAIEAALPLSGEASRWGDELYFRTPVDVGPEDAREEVAVGSVAYWSQGNAVCLFWGPTPASREGEPRAESPVNVVAVVDDVSPLEEIEEIEEIDGDATVTLRSG